MRTLLIPLLLSACAVPQPGNSVTYSCEGDLTLRVQFTRDAARVTLPGGEELLLPQQPAASGISYGTPQHQLRGKGDEATWTTGRRTPMACRVRR